MLGATVQELTSRDVAESADSAKPLKWGLTRGLTPGQTLSGGDMLKEFKEFISRGNVLDLAVGVIIGAAFGKIVTTLVENVIMPPIGLILGRIDFSSLFFVLDSGKGIPASLAEAKTKGVPVIAYGQFINDIVSFLIVALAVFIIIKQVNRLKRPMPVAGPTTKDCPQCLMAVPLKATRCGHCTSQI
jgi:large conductance mechanosensitive channel